MKRIGIISDTHGYLDPAVLRYFGECDEVWHAGDIGSDDVLTALQDICPTVRAVCGNIDGGRIRLSCPEWLEFETEGARVILTHIGGYPGRYTAGMRSRITETRPTLMVCGHSHILRVMYDRKLDVLHINPGAAGRQGWQQVRTVIRFDIDNGTPRNLEVIELAGRGKGSTCHKNN